MYNSYGATSDSVESAHFADIELGGYNVFSEKSVRLGFMRKVFGIVTIQLIITALIGTAFFVSDNVKQFTIENHWIIWISLIVSFISLLSLTIRNIYRSYPGNLICLILFTLSQSLTIGFYTSFSRGEVVLMAIVITAIVVIALVLFASQTLIDFTPVSGVLYCATICLILFGLACIIFPSKIIVLIFASLGAFFFSIWLVVDIQMLMGRNITYRLSPEDYIPASIIIYQDIITIFLNVLDIISLCRG